MHSGKVCGCRLGIAPLPHMQSPCPGATRFPGTWGATWSIPSRPGRTSHSARAPHGLIMGTRNSGWHTLSSKSRASATHSPFTESHVNVLTLFSYRFDIAQWRQQTDPQHRARETTKLQPHRTREPRPSPEKKNSDMQQHNTGKPHERAGDWR